MGPCRKQQEQEYVVGHWLKKHFSIFGIDCSGTYNTISHVLFSYSKLFIPCAIATAESTLIPLYSNINHNTGSLQLP